MSPSAPQNGAAKHRQELNDFEVLAYQLAQVEGTRPDKRKQQLLAAPAGSLSPPPLCDTAV